MPLLMLRPGWPGGRFRRAVQTGNRKRLIEFVKGEPVQVTDAQFAELEPVIGNAIFEAELDGKGRPRLIERVEGGEEAELV